MNLSANRLASGVLSIAAFSASFCLLLYISSRPGQGPVSAGSSPHPTLIVSVNMAIILAWASFGALGGTVMSAISIVSLSWLCLRYGFGGCWIFVLTFPVAAAIGFRYVYVRERLAGLYEFKIQKTEEQANVISDEINRRNASISAIEERLRRYSALRKVVEPLSGLLSAEEISRMIIDKSAGMIGDEDSRAMLLTVDTRKQALMLSVTSGGPRIMEKAGDIFDRWVLRHRTSLIVEDAGRDFRFPFDDSGLSAGSPRSLIAVPLTIEDKMTGILRMDSPRETAYSQDDLRLLGIIADLGAVAMNNAALYSRTQELATRDGLTGLIIRRHFLERLKEEISRAAIGKEKLYLLLLDIDHFKAYNDQYGHAAGDLVLKHIAAILEPLSREGDMIARYGGEEIAILFCGRDRPSAMREAENIRSRIETKPFTLRRHEAKMTVSIGVAGFPDDAVTETELIRAADTRLYKAKASGRNRVVG